MGNQQYLYFDDKCLQNGSYTFSIFDSGSNGICCDRGKGYFKVFVDDDMIAKGGEFKTEENIPFTVPSSLPPSSFLPTPNPTTISSLPSSILPTVSSIMPTIYSSSTPSSSTRLLTASSSSSPPTSFFVSKINPRKKNNNVLSSSYTCPDLITSEPTSKPSTATSSPTNNKRKKKPNKPSCYKQCDTLRPNKKNQCEQRCTPKP